VYAYISHSRSEYGAGRRKKGMVGQFGDFMGEMFKYLWEDEPAPGAAEQKKREAQIGALNKRIEESDRQIRAAKELKAKIEAEQAVSRYGFTSWFKGNKTPFPPPSPRAIPYSPTGWENLILNKTPTPSPLQYPTANPRIIQPYGQERYQERYQEAQNQARQLTLL
jgi:hypothetical protein